MTKEEKLQILESALNLAYQRLSFVTAEDMGGEHMSRLLDHMSNLGYLHERVMYPYKPLVVEDAPESDCPCHSCPKPDEPTSGDTETAAPVLDPAPNDLPKHPATDEPGEPTMTQTEVRKILSDLSGRVDIDLPGLLSKFGAEKLSLVDPTDYAALVEAAKAKARVHGVVV